MLLFMPETSYGGCVVLYFLADAVSRGFCLSMPGMADLIV